MLKQPWKHARPNATLALQATVLSFLLAWQLWSLQRQEVVDLDTFDTGSHGGPTAQWPYVVAATIFMMEFFICFGLILLLRLMLHFKDPSSGEVVFLVRLREVTEMLAFIALFAGIYYIYMLCRGPSSVRLGSGSFFEGKQEFREPWHVLLWTFLSPHQWAMHARLYTKASFFESLELMICTAYIMVFGLIGIQVDMAAEDAWISPHWQVRIAFTLSTLCMLSTFVKAARLQAEAATAENCSFYLKVKYVVWTGYPVAYLLRSANLLTYWQEEVLCYTTLDVVAKSLSLLASSTGPLFTLFVSTWGHWHISGGEHDFWVTVEDPSWNIQSVRMDRCAAKGQHATGLQAGSSNFLRDAVPAEDRKRLQTMAKQVDQQLSFMAQKTPLTVILNDVMAPAECYVSRSLWGSRQLAITLWVFGDEHITKCQDDDDTHSWSLSSQVDESEMSCPPGYEQSTLTLGKVALHHHLSRSHPMPEAPEAAFWQTARLPAEVSS